jgi:hypothetical protein
MSTQIISLRSHRFAGIQPNSGFGDYSRLSCGVGDTQLGRRPGSRQGCLCGRHQPSSRGFPGSEPNSDHGDHSRLSCSAGDTQLGAGFCRDLQQAFCTDVGHHAASPRRAPPFSPAIGCSSGGAVPAEQVMAVPERRAAAQAIMERLVELRARCERQTSSLVTPWAMKCSIAISNP